MAEIAWTPGALANIQEIAAYLQENESPQLALRVVERLMNAPSSLTHSPRMGRVVPEYKLDFVRELVFVRPYRIIYLARDDTCQIIRVIHSRRNLRKVLRKKDLKDL